MRTVVELVWAVALVEAGVVAGLLLAGVRYSRRAWADHETEMQATARLTAPLAPPRQELTPVTVPAAIEAGPRHASRAVATTPASYLPRHRAGAGPTTREFARIVAGLDAPVIGRPPRELVGAR